MFRDFSKFIYPLTLLLGLTLSACGGGGSGGGSSTPSDPTNADLSGLTISAGSLDQTFQASQLAYTASTSFANTTTTVTPVTTDAGATVTINGSTVSSGTASSAITLNQGSNPITVVVTSQDTTNTNTYTLDVTRQSASAFGQAAFLTATATTTDDGLGEQVSISGDTLVVGAPQINSNGTGAVYIFTKSGGVWTQQGNALQASNAGASDQFGKSVAIDGDTIIVGSPTEDSNETGTAGTGTDNSSNNSGAAYVFTRTGTTWSQQAYLKPSNTGADNLFGTDVSISNGTAVVGSNFEDTTAGNSGAAYVFTRSGSSWSEQALLKASDAANNDRFGISVSISSNTLAIGANKGNSNKGAVYVFSRTGTSWSQEGQAITAANGDDGDAFGFDVALSGDTLAIGAFVEGSSSGVDETDNTAPLSGAVYIFKRSSPTSWAQQAYIKQSIITAGDQFGKRIALFGDTLAVSADQKDSLTGAAYYFTRSGSAWTQQNPVLVADNRAANDLFGSSVALSADTLVIGAKGQSSNTGSVYIWE